MILSTDITEAGVLNKPHGIKGEISATLDYDIDLNEAKCIVMDVEGIFVPFFIKSVRPKTAETCLLTIDGINSEQKARQISGKTFYLLNNDLPENETDGEDGLYTSELIGYTVMDSVMGKLGKVTDYNDSTDNILLIVTNSDGKDIYIPVADEFIDEIDTDDNTLHTSLPQGIVDLNN